MKKSIGILMFILVSALTACGGPEDMIYVITREEGSGTRSAFCELTGVEDITLSAETNSSTAVVMQTVAGNPSAIGYISLGSLNDTVKALHIDSAQATPENVKNGSYVLGRPFYIATKNGLSDVARDFLNFILSAEGQAVIEENGYVSISAGEVFYSAKPVGEVTVAGSSSVAPVMEKLAEAYMSANTEAEVKLLTSDSSTGIRSAIEGLCDIGMTSRALKDKELEAGLTSTTLCMDGIAVIVHRNCPVENLSTEQLRQIFSGEITSWREVGA